MGVLDRHRGKSPGRLGPVTAQKGIPNSGWSFAYRRVRLCVGRTPPSSFPGRYEGTV